MAKGLYICNTDVHNKYWKYQTQSESTVYIEWGRIGGSSQNQTKSFSNDYRMHDFIAKKVSEKIAKGYKESNTEELKEETKTAQDLGAQFKISEVAWVCVSGPNQLTKITDYDPNQWVLVKVLNSWTKDVFSFIISKTSAEKINGLEDDLTFKSKHKTTDDFVDAVRRYVKRICESIQQVFLAKFGDVGVRKLDIEGAEAPTITQQMTNEIAAEVKMNISDQVIMAFAAMGRRKLDI